MYKNISSWWGICKDTGRIGLQNSRRTEFGTEERQKEGVCDVLTSAQSFIALLLAALGQQGEDIADLSVTHHLLCHLLTATLKWLHQAPPTIYIVRRKKTHILCHVFLWPHPHHPLSTICFSTVVEKKETKESRFIPQGTASLQFSSSSSYPFSLPVTQVFFFEKPQ